MLQKSRIKALYILLLSSLIMALVIFLAQTHVSAQESRERVKAGGWIADTLVNEGEEAAEFIFSGENENGYATQRVFSEKGFDVDYPIAFSALFSWDVPYPDSFGINFCRSNDEYENWAAGQVSSDNRFQFLIDNRGYFIEPGAWADWYQDFEDKNRYPEPEYNDFIFNIGEEYTTITINGITYGNTLRFKKSDFPQGRVYISLGTIGTREGYTLKLKNIDGVYCKGSAVRVVKSNTHEPFYLEAASDFRIFYKENEVTDYVYDNGELLFDEKFIETLPLGKTVLQCNSGVEIFDLTLIKETPEREEGNWSVSCKNFSGVSIAGHGIDITSESFGLQYNDVLSPGNGIQIDFRVDSGLQYGESILFSIGNIVLTVGEDGEAQLSYKNGLKNSETIHFSAPFGGTKHSVGCFFDDDDFIVTVDNKMYTPLLKKSQVPEEFAVEISACFAAEKNCFVGEPVEYKAVQTGGLGFNSKLNSEYILNEDATIAFNVADAKFNHSKGELFSEERIYSEKGYDVNKPIILSVFYDVLNSGNGYYGFNITPYKYGFGEIDMFQDPKFDVKVEGIPRGSYLSGAKAAGSPVQITNCRNLHYGSYVSTGLLNVFEIEIGLTQTKITVNGESEQVYSIRRSDFDISGGKAYFNFGFNTTNASQKLQLVLKAVNSPDPGFINSQNYIIGKTNEVAFCLKCADYESLALKYENGETIEKANYTVDPASGKLVLKDSFLKNLILEEKSYRIKLCSSEDENVGTWLTVFGLITGDMGGENIGDEGIPSDNAGKTPNLLPLWICIGIVVGAAVAFAVYLYIKNKKIGSDEKRR